MMMTKIGFTSEAVKHKKESDLPILTSDPVTRFVSASVRHALLLLYQRYDYIILIPPENRSNQCHT